MLGMLLLLAAPGQQAVIAGNLDRSAIDAERAFDAQAGANGQWTAFRAWASDKAILFAPGPVDAQSWLRDRADPAASVRWQPLQSFVSCDGATAINTGAWQRPNGTTGYFTTVWQRRQDGAWRWVLDFGDALKTPLKAHDPVVTTASCKAPTRALPRFAAGGGTSAGGSLRWWFTIGPDGRRTLAADYWDGRRFRPAIADQTSD